MKKSKHGMRRGFACIFYGAPGTGKTETVLQLAHRTGRGIMTVDVPNLRSKWVGDTEKNTKAIFERYRNYCKRADLALVWSYDPTNKVLTIGNAGEFTENMRFGVEAPTEMRELVVGNSVTAIGAGAFAGIVSI